MIVELELRAWDDNWTVRSDRNDEGCICAQFQAGPFDNEDYAPYPPILINEPIDA